MSMKLTSLVCIPLLFGCAAAGAAPAHPAAPHEACEIRAFDMPGGMMRLESVVYGAPGTYGSYQMSMERSGPGGTSNVSQGGEYEIGPEGDAVVSVTEVNRGPRDRYSAVMTIDSASGPYRCEF
ncbi:MAG: hypothetical protein LPK88_03970 [Alphaproteobacteria bacterium]|nr:hypothetical protein [Alphaproteobacteria bacterium]MDX5415461.1 hypothetical protein [Alphaproteobacteria bacterium]MDX5492692.1 hypothetical protein [Alphaproteobacteria bacterium]